MIIASDLEGTLTTGETWRGVGKFVSQNGRKWAYRRYLATHLPTAVLAKAGLINRTRERYRWVIDMAELVKGYSTEQLTEMGTWVAQYEMWPKRRQAVIDEVLTHARNGAQIVLLSGTYQPILDAFAQCLMREAPGILPIVAIASPLEVKDGLATGKLDGPLNVEQAKADRAQAWLRGAHADTAGIDMMYGDTLGDLQMMELSRTPVCVYPSAALRRIALARGWRILEAR
ncbi:MAG: HAD family hydrolase [Anaerolineae bacterium]